MERILIFQIMLCLSSTLYAQNYLKNGSFEHINKQIGDKGDFYTKNFFCEDWFEPTKCSVDIYRSLDACDDKHFIGTSPHMATCVNTFAGNYCIGLFSIAEDGYMEHITGKLKQTLEKGQLYKISFAVRYWGGKPRFSKGFGYKFSSDSILFKSNRMMSFGDGFDKLSPFYQDLFGVHKIYSDFQFEEYLTDTVWQHHTTYYMAKGGERFLTFGQFSFANDQEIIRQISKYKTILSQVGRENFIKSGKISFIKQIDAVDAELKELNLSSNYYLLDDVKVEQATAAETLQAQQTCANGCVDLDPLTIQIPSRREVFIDRGFEGEISFSIHANLRPREKLVIELDKDNKITVLSDDLTKTANLVYDFKYPAKKIRGKIISYYVEKVIVDEISSLKCLKEPLVKNNFKGWVLKCKD